MSLGTPAYYLSWVGVAGALHVRTISLDPCKINWAILEPPVELLNVLGLGSGVPTYSIGWRPACSSARPGPPHGYIHHAILCYTVLYYTVLYYTIVYCTILYCTILYYIVVYCTILYYAMLCYTVLYLTMLFAGFFPPNWKRFLKVNTILELCWEENPRRTIKLIVIVIVIVTITPNPYIYIYIYIYTCLYVCVCIYIYIYK